MGGGGGELGEDKNNFLSLLLAIIRILMNECKMNQYKEELRSKGDCKQ